MPYTYPFDPDGVLASNLISNETHVVTAPTEPNKANFIVPSFGPFFGNSLVVEHVNGATITPLVAGVDYQLGAQWYEMRSSFSQMVYAAISFMNLSFSGNVRITYQTVGGPYTDVDQSFLLNLAQSLYKLRNINWSQIVGPLVQFPVDPHNHTVEDVLADQVVQKLEDIADAIIAHPPAVGAVSDGVSIEGSGTLGSPFSVKRSTDSGNLLTLRDNGLYYGIQAPANVSNLYVSTSLGDDTNPGTQALPLKTIAAALAKVAGDVSSTIHLRAGEIYPMDTKVFMSGTAVRNIVPYDDPYYDGAIHNAILADGAQHLQAYTQEIDRPILEFTWTVAPAPNNTQAFSTGGWVCKNASSVVFDAIHLRMSAYPPGYPGVLRASGSSKNTVFLGAGVFGFQGCKLEYGFASVDNILGRFFRPSGTDVPTLSFVGTTLIDAGSRDFMTISTGSVRINVRDTQATVGGTTSQVVTPMPGNAGVAFTTRQIEGVVWGQDGMPTNVSTNLAISRDGHLPLATDQNAGAVLLAATAELPAPNTIPNDGVPRVYTADQVASIIAQIRSITEVPVYGIIHTHREFFDTSDVAQTYGYGVWRPHATGRALVGVADDRYKASQNLDQTEVGRVGNQFGSAKQTLTVDNLPPHQHQLCDANSGEVNSLDGGDSKDWGLDTRPWPDAPFPETVGSPTFRTTLTGNGDSFSIAQPSETIGCWMRVPDGYPQFVDDTMTYNSSSPAQPTSYTFTLKADASLWLTPPPLATMLYGVVEVAVMRRVWHNPADEGDLSEPHYTTMVVLGSRDIIADNTIGENDFNKALTITLDSSLAVHLVRDFLVVRFTAATANFIEYNDPVPPGTRSTKAPFVRPDTFRVLLAHT